MSKKQDKEELFRQIMARADEAHTHDFDNRADAMDDLQFKLGGIHQWDPTVLKERTDDNRPCETINRMPQFIRQVTNDARENRPAIKVRGVDDESDPETAAVLEGIIRHIEDQSEAVSTAYITGIDNSASCGIGHWRIKTEYADDDTFGQDIIIEGIPNPLAVLWDPVAKKATREDARYCFVMEDISEDEFEELYPDKPMADFAIDGSQGLFWRDAAAKTVRIAEYWCKEPVDKTIGLTADGKTIDLTDIPAMSVKFLGITETRKVKSHKVVQYIVSGHGILEGPNDFASKYIPVIAVIGEEIHLGDTRKRISVIRHAKPAQRLYNIWRNAQTEQIALQPKSPIMATGKQIEKYKDIWKQANKRSFPYIPYDPDGTAPPPQRLQPAQISTAMSEAVAIAADEMKSTTGIYDAALGDKSNETSGIAIQNRQRESDVSNAHFADNLALSIRHTGRILIDLIPQIYDTEKTVRLLNEDGTENYERINAQVMGPEGPMYVHDLSVGKYDVTVKTGPSYQTRRQEAADSMMQFIQTVPDSAQFVVDLLAKNMDWPGADEIAKRFRMMLMKTHPDLVEKNDEEETPQPTQADQMNALMMQMEARTKEADARKTEAEAEKAEMETAKTGMEVAQMAAVGPIGMAVQQAVMKVLADLGVPDQPQGQPGQSSAGMVPAPQPQLVN